MDTPTTTRRKKKSTQSDSTESPFLCSECKSPLMPLHHAAGTCPNGHGRVRTGLPKLALQWLADQHSRGRTASEVRYCSSDDKLRTFEVEGKSFKFQLHRITGDGLRRRSVPKVGDDLPDGCIVGVFGMRVRMLKPQTASG